MTCTRREFLKIFALTLTGGAISACSGEPVKPPLIPSSISPNLDRRIIGEVHLDPRLLNPVPTIENVPSLRAVFDAHNQRNIVNVRLAGNSNFTPILPTATLETKADYVMFQAQGTLHSGKPEKYILQTFYPFRGPIDPNTVVDLHAEYLESVYDYRAVENTKATLLVNAGDQQFIAHLDEGDGWMPLSRQAVDLEYKVSTTSKYYNEPRFIGGTELFNQYSSDPSIAANQRLERRLLQERNTRDYEKIIHEAGRQLDQFLNTHNARKGAVPVVYTGIDDFDAVATRLATPADIINLKNAKTLPPGWVHLDSGQYVRVRWFFDPRKFIPLNLRDIAKTLGGRTYQNLVTNAMSWEAYESFPLRFDDAMIRGSRPTPVTILQIDKETAPLARLIAETELKTNILPSQPSNTYASWLTNAKNKFATIAQNRKIIMETGVKSLSYAGEIAVLALSYFDLVKAANPLTEPFSAKVDLTDASYREIERAYSSNANVAAIRQDLRYKALLNQTNGQFLDYRPLFFRINDLNKLAVMQSGSILANNSVAINTNAVLNPAKAETMLIGSTKHTVSFNIDFGNGKKVQLPMIAQITIAALKDKIGLTKMTVQYLESPDTENPKGVFKQMELKIEDGKVYIVNGDLNKLNTKGIPMMVKPFDEQTEKDLRLSWKNKDPQELDAFFAPRKVFMRITADGNFIFIPEEVVTPPADKTTRRQEFGQLASALVNLLTPTWLRG